MSDHFSRRDFVKTSAVFAAAAMAGPLIRTAVAKPSASRLKIGLIGCGGRGTGAAVNALEASPDAEIIALADVFQDRLDGCFNALNSQPDEIRKRISIAPDHRFTGFDAYQELLNTDVDLVILATPPHFRPIHLAAAIDKGKHAFIEKPVAVDPTGIRSVLHSAEIADAKKLCIVAGTQRRHETSYLEALKRIEEGAIGEIVSASCYWNQGGLWMNDRRPEWSDMEWQLRNWLYFTWLSGDHIVEQHVHNLDVVNWAMGEHSRQCMGMGGRQVRTAPSYGNVFDHFAIEYEFSNGVTSTSMCRQIDGCAGRVEEVLHGTKGRCYLSPGAARIEGQNAWHFSSNNNNPYVQEHADLIHAIMNAGHINEARQVAESTLTAIMGRMSAYTGKSLTWQQAIESKLDLCPAKYELGEIAVADVAVPGRTPLI